jgi:hypothetical protein
MMEGRPRLCLCTFGQSHTGGGQEDLVGVDDEGDTFREITRESMT